MYLLDANVFIEAKNFYYRFDTFPGFWDWLDREQTGGRLATIEPIAEELMRGNDELAEWIKARKGGAWFLAVDDQATQEKLAEIAAWVMAQPFAEPAKADFLSGGDPWLIAKAATLGATVVTQERFDAQSRKKIRIPNVCAAFGVPYADTFELLRKLGASFRL